MNRAPRDGTGPSGSRPTGDLARSEKRDAVLDSMVELVAEHGFEGAPMALVAERAKVATGTIYRHFESKKAVIAACYEELDEQLYAAVMEDYPQGGSVRGRFLHLATAVIRHFLERPREFRFFQQFLDSPYGAQPHGERLFGSGEHSLVGALLQEGRALQVFKDLPAPVLFALAFGPIASLCQGSALGSVELEGPLLARTAEACWDAIRR